MKMLRKGYLFIIVALLLSGTPLPVFSAGGLILPMPGNSPTETKKQGKTGQQQKKPDKKKQATQQTKPSNALASPKATTNNQNNNIKDGNDLLIPLPTATENTNSQQNVATNKPPANTEKTHETPIIPITQELPPPATDSDMPVPPDEFVVESEKVINDILPPAAKSETPSNTVANGTSYPIFPKDTSSAIFMVMKTWQCDNYDAASLLTQAVKIYGDEATDQFKIEGISEAECKFEVTVEEEDITLDELLDIVAQKAGRDWGVDIPSKTIYFYPAGISSE